MIDVTRSLVLYHFFADCSNRLIAHAKIPLRTAPLSSTAIDLQEKRSSIWAPSFQSLLWTNWLTAINDNAFRWFVIGAGKTYVEPGDHGQILMLGTILFVVPYLLLAAPAGWLADRFSKRNVIVACKVLEIIVMMIGIGSLLLGSLTLLMVTVFLMGAQSAMFSPAKIGTIPELLDESEISKGNGVFNLATLSAVIIGMGIGGWLADMAGDRGQSNIWLTGVTLIGIAVVGTIISLAIQSQGAAKPNAKFPINLPAHTWGDLCSLFSMGRLFRVALGSLFFYAIASFAQLNVDTFAAESGSINETEKLPLLISLVMGVGVGSLLAGIISGGKIELGLVPWGAVGMSVFGVLLFFTPANFIGESTGFGFVLACVLLAGLGVSAGFFDVPLASYLQHNSPPDRRGAIFSASNFMTFTGIALMAVLYAALTFGNNAGSLSKLSADLYSPSVSEADNSKIQAVVDQYSSAAGEQLAVTDKSTGGEIDLTTDSYLEALPESLRATAFSKMIDSEIDLRKDAGFQASMASFSSGNRFSSLQQRQIRKVLQQSGKLPLFSSRSVFLIMGLITIPVVLYSIYRLSREMVRMAWLVMMRVVYNVRITGVENVPKTGAAVLIPNHSSWLDAIIFRVFPPRTVRIIAWAGNFKSGVMKKWADFCGVILMGGGPKSIRNAFKVAREALDEGEVLGVFAEGGISRSNQVRSFKPGVLKILGEREVPVIPVYFDELWGSILSYSEGKAFTKFPRTFRRPVSIHYGKPIEPHPKTMHEIQKSVQRLSTRTVNNYAGKIAPPIVEFVYSCKRQKKKSKIADSLGSEETGGILLTRALVLRRLLRREVFSPDETNVGVLIPPTVGGAIVNLSLGLDKRVAVNLNYSLSEELINHCIREAGIKHVLTTKKVAEKLNFNLDAEVVFLDDLKEKVSGADKGLSWFEAFLMPGGLLVRKLGLHKLKVDDVMTIVFTSGSTGVPKGVMLTHQNVHFDVRGFEKAAAFRPNNDTIIGILPFFHSFGYTVTLWAPMMCDIRAAYHLNPLDAKQIGKLTKRHSGTILMTTPTFLRSYMRRCTPEQFATLDAVVTGAERLPPELANQFEEKFGVMPVEGYGVTELSPGVAANIPASRRNGTFQVDAKPGTVGRPIANVAAKVCDLETGEELPPNEPGMLWITGPIVMKGYLNNPEATNEVIVDGWYKTGDVGLIDEDGFIKITGRISRFSKIGGEMVPHLKIEELLSHFLDTTPEDDEDDHLSVAITAVPCERKGEKLIVLYTRDHKTVDEMTAVLKDAGLPNVFIPSSDSFFRVDALPILGTGKIDLKGIKDKAIELAGG